jgi:site-specific recombinase XerD
VAAGHRVGQQEPKTIKSHAASVGSLATFLRDHDMPDGIEDVAPEHIRAFLLAERERTPSAFAQQHYRNLHVYFRWVEAEEERKSPNPMVRVDKPAMPEAVKPFFTEAEITALLRACSGQDFESAATQRSSASWSTPGSGCPAWPGCGSAPRTTTRPTCSATAQALGDVKGR